jgi:hypothetical protein
MNPGVTIMPFASTIFTLAPARFLTSALEPTASMRSPRTSTASAQGRRGSPVQTRALTMASAETGGGAGARADCDMARAESSERSESASFTARE